MALLIAAILAVSMAPETPWIKELPDALHESKKLDRDLLIDFSGSDWCGPCASLKHDILTKPEFEKAVSNTFVLVDIDDLYHGNPPDRTQRYKKLQKAYGIDSFPSVVLATPEGKAYAWTTYSPDYDTPQKFLAQLTPLERRGRIFREKVREAGTERGAKQAASLVAGMSEVPADILWRFHEPLIAELKSADAQDRTGFMGFLDARQALQGFQDRVGGGYKWAANVTPETVDGLIGKWHLKGEMLQQALSMKASLETKAGHPVEALRCFDQVVKAFDSWGRYDRGDFMPSTKENMAVLAKRVSEGLATPGDLRSEYYALERIFEFDLPNRFELSCGEYLAPGWPVRETIAEIYGKALLASTSSLSGEERAKALTDGLKDTRLLATPTMRKVLTSVTTLVGRDRAAELLPDWYRSWAGVPAQPAKSGG